MSTLPADRVEELGRVQRQALAVGGVTLLACVIGAPFSPQQFFRAYLAAYQLYLGIALGSFAILMLYHLTGGAWGFTIRRLLEAAMRTLPLLAILFTPIAFSLSSLVPPTERLYPWAEPAVVSGSEELKYNHIYLNVWFWWGRTALFFVAWMAVAFILSTWSRQQDRTGETQLPRKFRLLSAPGLVVYGATITFASVDWVMSLQPEFHSTIFPPEFAAGQLVSGMAFVLLVLAWLVNRPPFADLISLETLNDLGNLLLTFLVIWAYMTFFQFMLIWMANLPDEAAWYLPRSRNGWQGVAWAVFVLHFAVPFFCLLLRDVKRDPRALAWVAGLLLVMHLVFLYFQIMPAFENHPGANSLGQHWMDFLTPFGVGGIWLWYFLWQLQQNPVLPRHDPSRLEAERLRRADLEAAAREEAIRHG